MKTKICSKCKEQKSLSNFDRQKSYKDGLRGQCRDCRRAYSAEYNKTREKKPRYKCPARSRNHRIKWEYGIDTAKFEALAKKQANRCAICNKHAAETRYGVLSIDHCHRTGRVRGLLCPNCNAGLARFGDSTEGIMKALKYLTEASL